MDWLVTGDALHSLHGTAALAETVDRRRDPLTGPYWTAQYLGYTLREPLVVGIPIGLFFAWRQRLRGAILPLAVAAAMLAVFLASPLFGLPLIGRYVRTPAVLLALFYGLAVFGWRMLPPGDERRRWLVAGVLAAALSVAFLPWHVKMLSGLDERLVYQGAYYRDLREVGRAPARARRARRVRADRDGRPPPDPAPALVARGRPGHRRPRRRPRGRARLAAAAAPAPDPPDAALLPRELPDHQAPGRLAAALPQRLLAGVRGAGLLADGIGAVGVGGRDAGGRAGRSRARGRLRARGGRLARLRAAPRRSADRDRPLGEDDRPRDAAQREHVAAGRARFEAVALEQADFGGERFDTIFGVHVAALWRSQAALAVVRAHLAPAGALYIVNQLPGRRTRAEAEAFAEPVAAALRAHGLAVEAPRFADLEPSPVACVIARQPSAPRGST